MRDLMFQYPVLSTVILCSSWAAICAGFFVLVYRLNGKGTDE